MSDQEASVSLSQLGHLLNAVDLDKLRDADGQIDTVKLASLVTGVTPPTARRGPTATGHQSNAGGRGRGTGITGREMYESRHRKAAYDE